MASIENENRESILARDQKVYSTLHICLFYHHPMNYKKKVPEFTLSLKEHHYYIHPRDF